MLADMIRKELKTEKKSKDELVLNLGCWLWCVILGKWDSERQMIILMLALSLIKWNYRLSFKHQLKTLQDLDRPNYKEEQQIPENCCPLQLKQCFKYSVIFFTLMLPIVTMIKYIVGTQDFADILQTKAEHRADGRLSQGFEYNGKIVQLKLLFASILC